MIFLRPHGERAVAVVPNDNEIVHLAPDEDRTIHLLPGNADTLHAVPRSGPGGMQATPGYMGPGSDKGQ